MPDVFISYSRKDKDFVKRLHGELAALNRDVWVDWEDIPATADWWREIQGGIESADTFVFIISPDSVASEVCEKEIEYALANNKRFMPILRRQAFEGETAQIKLNVHPAINSHNWIYFRDQDDFNTSLKTLLDAMDTDLSYVREHTRLLIRAREWNEAKRDGGLLLNGIETRQAESWLTDALGKTPAPTELHKTYIYASRQAENGRQRRLQLGVAVALVITIALAIYGLTQATLAGNNFATAQVRVTEVAQQAGTAQANYNLAQANAIEAQNNAGTAAANAVIAQEAQGTAQANAVIAQQAADDNATAQAVAVHEADNRATQQILAQNNAATAQSAGATSDANAVIAQNAADANATAQAVALNQAGTAQAAGSTSDANAVIAQNAADANATAQAVAVDQAATAQAARATSDANVIIAQNAADANATAQAVAVNQAATAQAAGATSQANAYLAATSQSNALNSAATAAFEQGRAENNAGTAQAAGATSDANAIIAQAAADANGTAQAVAVREADSRATQQLLAQANAATAQAAQATAVTNEQLVRAQALAVSAEQILDAGNPDVAIAMAIQAGEINPNLTQAQRLLNRAAPFAVRYNLSETATSSTETYKDFLGRTKSRTIYTYSFSGLFSPDNNYFVDSPDGVTLNLWDLKTSSTTPYHTFVGHQAWVTAAVFSTDMRYLISGDANGDIIVWDVTSGLLLRHLQGHTQRITALTYNPRIGMQQVASGSADKSAILWDVESGNALFDLPGFSAPVNAIFFVQDGSRALALAVDDTHQQSADLAVGQNPAKAFHTLIAPYRGYGYGNQQLYSYAKGDKSGGLEIWNVFTPRSAAYRTFGLGNSFNNDYANISQVAFTPDGRYVLVHVEGRKDVDRDTYTVTRHSVELWQLGNGELAYELNLGYDKFQPNSWNITSLAVSPVLQADGTQYALIGGLFDRVYAVILWDIQNKREIRRFTGYNRPITHVGFSPDGRFAYATAEGTTGAVTRVWDLSERTVAQIKTIDPGSATITTVAFEPFPIMESQPSDTGVVTTTFDSSNPIIYGYTGSNAVSAWRMRDNVKVSVTTVGLSARFAFNPLMPQMMILSYDKQHENSSATLVDMTNGTNIFQSGVQKTWVTAAGYSTDGHTLVFGGYQSLSPGGSQPRVDTYSLTIWNSDTQKTIRTIGLPDDLKSIPIVLVALSPDDNTAVSVSRAADGTQFIVLWDLKTGTEAHRLVGYNSPISALAFNPNGRNIAAALSSENLVRVWDVATGDEILSLIGHKDAVNALAFSPDGETLLTGSSDKDVILWDMSNGQILRHFTGHTDKVNGVAFSSDGRMALSSSNKDGIFVWRIESLRETINWIKSNRYTIALTCPQRLQYNVRPFCVDGIVPSATATGTLLPSATPSITPTPTLTPTPTNTRIPYATIRSNGPVNLRSGNGTGFAVIQALKSGDRVIVLQISPDFWTQVQLVDEPSVIGWVLSSVVVPDN